MPEEILDDKDEFGNECRFCKVRIPDGHMCMRCEKHYDDAMSERAALLAEMEGE